MYWQTSTIVNYSFPSHYFFHVAFYVLPSINIVSLILYFAVSTLLYMCVCIGPSCYHILFSLLFCLFIYIKQYKNVTTVLWCLYIQNIVSYYFNYLYRKIIWFIWQVACHTFSSNIMSSVKESCFCIRTTQKIK